SLHWISPSCPLGRGFLSGRSRRHRGAAVTVLTVALRRSFPFCRESFDSRVSVKPGHLLSTKCCKRDRLSGIGPHRRDQEFHFLLLRRRVRNSPDGSN